jgi:hypothetical protein
MHHPLTKVITFVVADGNTFVRIDVMPQRDKLHTHTHTHTHALARAQK